MTWNANSAGVFTLTGAGRAVVVAPDAQPGNVAVLLEPSNYTENVKAVLLSSPDGRTCIEAGIEGANAVLRSVSLGGTPVVLTNAASDTPASAPASAAHGLTLTTRPVRIDARVTDDVLSLRIDGTLVVQHALTAQEKADFRHLRHVGFVGDVDGTVVLSAAHATLTPTFAGRAEILTVVVGGDWMHSTDGETIQTISGGAGTLAGSGTVTIAELNQNLYAVDGTRARVYDPGTNTVSDWTATEGALPGATGPGTTTATLIERHRGRLFLSGVESDPQNIYASRINDPLDFDTGANIIGFAFSVQTAEAGLIGQPVRAMRSNSEGALVVGCDNSMHVLVGDPAATGVVQTRRIAEVGVTGKDSLALLASGVVAAHSPDGFYAVSGETATPISAGTLSGLIELDDSERGTIDVVAGYDAARETIMLFRSDGTAIAYSHTIGGMRPGSGGFFIDDAVTVTAATRWRGKLVLGTSDGRLLEYDDAEADDYTGPIDAFTNVQIVLPPASDMDALLNEFRVVPGIDGGAVAMTVYGGISAEAAFDADARVELFAGSIEDARETSERPRVRAPAIAVEIRNAASGETLLVEDVSATVRFGLRFGWLQNVPEPATPSSPDPEDETPTTPSFEEGPGDGSDQQPPDPSNPGGGEPPETPTGGGNPPSPTAPDPETPFSGDIPGGSQIVPR